MQVGIAKLGITTYATVVRRGITTRENPILYMGRLWVRKILVVANNPGVLYSLIENIINLIVVIISCGFVGEFENGMRSNYDVHFILGQDYSAQ